MQPKPSAVITITETEQGLRIETKYLLADGVSEAADPESITHSIAAYMLHSLQNEATDGILEGVEIREVGYATRLS